MPEKTLTVTGVVLWSVADPPSVSFAAEATDGVKVYEPAGVEAVMPPELLSVPPPLAMGALLAALGQVPVSWPALVTVKLV